MPPGVPGVPPQWWATPPMTDPKMLLPQPCLAEDAGRDSSVNPRNNSFLVDNEFQKWPCLGNNSVWVGQSYPAWWYTYPSEKYDFVSWDDYSQYMESHKSHVPWSKPPTSIYIFSAKLTRHSSWINLIFCQLWSDFFNNPQGQGHFCEQSWKFAAWCFEQRSRKKNLYSDHVCMVMPTPRLKEIGKQLHDWADCTVLCNPVFTNEIRACTWTGHLEMGQNLKYHILEGMTIRLPAILFTSPGSWSVAISTWTRWIATGDSMCQPPWCIGFSPTSLIVFCKFIISLTKSPEGGAPSCVCWFMVYVSPIEISIINITYRN